MKRALIVTTVVFFMNFQLASQVVNTSNASSQATLGALKSSDTAIQDTMDFKSVAERLDHGTMLAMTTVDYPVTPGDVYTLTYLHSYTSSSINVVVESDYTINLSLFGKLNAKGMIFTDLKKQVEALVLRSYKDSLPQLVIRNVGTFQVMVRGEVSVAELATTWGLVRLSSIISGRTTSYSSIRDVEVREANGTIRRYDLFRASRTGDLTQDPYVHPGDTVTIGKLDRKVTVSGEVRRPGTYQLLPGENLLTLIDMYGDGFTEYADASRLQITRSVTNIRDKEAETILFSRSDGRFNAEVLQNLDQVIVTSRMDYLPLITFEGAVNPDGFVLQNDSSSVQQQPDSTPLGTLRYQLKNGDTLSTVLRDIRDKISKKADLSNGYMTRIDDPTQRQINLEKLIYGYNPAFDIVLKGGDRIVIPYGNFEVFVTGEVKRSAWIGTGSLTRLSAAIGDFLTDYSSNRDVEVVSAQGHKRVYDLFRASRFGEREQDPYLNPGDTIRIKQLSRKVTLQGEVKYPGIYQLLDGEEMDTLINIYGGGFSKMADPKRIRIKRYDTGTDTPIEKIYFHINGNNGDQSLRDLDVVVVDKKDDYLPVVFFEGAIGSEVDKSAVIPEATNRFVYRISEGELLSTILRQSVNYFTAVSDLKNAYIIRIGEPSPIKIDLEILLYTYSPEKDIVMKSNDTVIIPFRQYFVSVAGAVMNPGRYPYVPDRTWKYYINLAGGLNPERNVFDAVIITDKDEKVRSKADFIQPEDRIFAETNDPLYTFGKFSGILSTILSLSAVVLGILNALKP